MSQRFRLGRTMSLWILKRFRPVFNIVALQLQKLVQKLDHEAALTRMIGLSCNLVEDDHLGIGTIKISYHLDK